MRKIESEMLAAICNNRNWTSGNTTVSVYSHKADATIEVRLHGNLIAEYTTFGGWRVTLAGWDTNTTRSRLNAILREFHGNSGVCRKRGALLIVRDGHGTPIDESGWYKAA